MITKQKRREERKGEERKAEESRGQESRGQERTGQESRGEQRTGQERTGQESRGEVIEAFVIVLEMGGLDLNKWGHAMSSSTTCGVNLQCKQDAQLTQGQLSKTH